MTTHTYKTHTYKKMAGTSAVFLAADFGQASPVERDGMEWSATELSLDQIPAQLNVKPDMATVLALEGLEEYDAPSHGDVRRVESVDARFVYLERIKGWVQLMSDQSCPA